MSDTTRSDSAGLSQAMANVNMQEEQDEQEEEIASGTEQRMADVLPPVFRTHSNAVRARTAADQLALKQTIADLDAKIEALNSERTDAMLAFSAGEAAKRALENGA